MEKQLISVIVTVYNVEHYLRRCVDSILAQTYEELEIILIDDGSTDRSAQICDEYAAGDCRIKVIHKKNGGAAEARNTGLETARGEYIGFVDGDDYIFPEMYEVLYHACVQQKVSIAMCGRMISDERFHTKDYQFCMKIPTLFTAKEAITGLLKNQNCDSASCDKLYKRFLFAKIRYPVGIEYDDLNVTARIIQLAGKVYHVGEALYVYVKRDGSVTARPFHKEHLDEIEQARLLKKFVDEKYPDLKKESVHFVYFNVAAVLFRAYGCKDPKMRKYMEKVVRYSESYIRHVINGPWTCKEKLTFLRHYIVVKMRLWRWS